MIAVVDYGAGNLGSVARALARLSLPHRVVSCGEDLGRPAGIVLPGVGAVGDAVRELRARGLWEALERAVAEGVPLLGICLGFQLLFGESEEGGVGFGWIAGRVVRLRTSLKVPHMGWNQVWWRVSHPLLAGIPSGEYFYFVHSYYGLPEDPDVVVGETEYGERFPVAVAQGHLVGVQFHPEKSGAVGHRLLRNFGEVVLGAGGARG